MISASHRPQLAITIMMLGPYPKSRAHTVLCMPFGAKMRRWVVGVRDPGSPRYRGTVKGKVKVRSRSRLSLVNVKDGGGGNMGARFSVTGFMRRSGPGIRIPPFANSMYDGACVLTVKTV